MLAIAPYYTQRHTPTTSNAKFATTCGATTCSQTQHTLPLAAHVQSHVNNTTILPSCQENGARPPPPPHPPPRGPLDPQPFQMPTCLKLVPGPSRLSMVGAWGSRTSLPAGGLVTMRLRQPILCGSADPGLQAQHRCRGNGLGTAKVPG